MINSIAVRPEDRPGYVPPVPPTRKFITVRNGQVTSVLFDDPARHDRELGSVFEVPLTLAVSVMGRVPVEAVEPKTTA
ncbi:hypothetical protein [Variovorax sp. PBL-E5]|uniref:hypothetical protein n=1 Tax=Variovorax sp. PBL-E5 TaxID=434014 RepID=UPI001318FC4D|nr:hypothetical protein [Variovorax sp. PBL-E5]VTU29961.1 hypothetical protein E5CHR_02917 [Variovorax sp. PBL-E5]